MVCVSLLGEVLLFRSAAACASLHAAAGVRAGRAHGGRGASASLATRAAARRASASACPVPFDDATGVVRFAPNLGWRNVERAAGADRCARAAERLRRAVQLQNDADTAALGEYEFPAARARIR